MNGVQGWRATARRVSVTCAAPARSSRPAGRISQEAPRRTRPEKVSDERGRGKDVLQAMQTAGGHRRLQTSWQSAEAGALATRHPADQAETGKQQGRLLRFGYGLRHVEQDGRVG